MQKKRFWILIGIGVVLLFSFILLSNIISVGERLRGIHAYIEYAFYPDGKLAFLLIQKAKHGDGIKGQSKKKNRGGIES